MIVARVNDICQGYCMACKCAMTGRIITGASTVLCNKVPIANMHGIVQGECGHVGYIVGLSKNFANKSPIALLGSIFYGTFSGQIVTGSNNVGSL